MTAASAPPLDARAVLSPRRRTIALGTLALLVVTAAAVAVTIGPQGLSLDPDLMPLRATRVILAVVVGAGLSATGAALQALMKNPLADPYVLGVSGGAAMGGAFAIAFVPAIGAASTSLLARGGLHAAAALGALLATLLLAWFLARDKSGRGEAALLVGITLNAFSWALVAVVRAALPAERTQVLSVWLVGSVGYPERTDLVVAAVVTALGTALLVAIAGDLMLMRAGEEEAARLGVRLKRTKLVAYGAASLLVGVAVSTTGVIGFIGLIAPHACRLALGRDERLVIPASALAGALSLVVFDAAARASFVLFPSELPTGALTAVVGAPLFALALWRRVSRGGAG